MLAVGGVKFNDFKFVGKELHCLDCSEVSFFGKFEKFFWHREISQGERTLQLISPAAARPGVVFPAL